MDTLITGALICGARIIDVSLNTLKFKALMRGNKLKASMLAFIEVLVYMLAASKAFKYIDNTIILLMYCLGYALGNYIGIILDEKLAKGNLFVLLIGDRDEEIIELADILREKGFGLTTEKGWGLNGTPKFQIKAVVDKQKFELFKQTVEDFHSKSVFMTVLEVKDAQTLECNSTSRV